MVTRNVTAPDPSRCTSNASKSGADDDARGVRSDGAKNPIDDRIEQAGVGHDAEVHNREDEHRATDAVCCSPATMNFAVSNPKPATSAVVTGTVISATSGDITRLMMTTSSTKHGDQAEQRDHRTACCVIDGSGRSSGTATALERTRDDVTGP